jgi:glycosyltransferase involved in cell wall biosynthesis
MNTMTFEVKIVKVLHLLVSGNSGGIEVLMKEYSVYSKHENVFLFAWDGGELAEEIEKNGSKIIILNQKKDGNIATLKKIFKICKEENIDVVVSHHSAPLFKIAIIYINIMLRRIKTIAYAHANAYDICDGDKKSFLYIKKIIHRTAFNMSDATVAISESVRESLINYLGVKENKIHVIYNGVSLKKFEPIYKKMTDNKVNFIYVGRLIKYKGVQSILKALALIDEEVNFNIKIVGDGSYRLQLQNLSKELGLEERVEFCGNRRDVPELLGKSDVFIHMPVWEEGFGITVVEAMAAGKICIVSNSGALSELITDEKNGFLVEKGNVEELASKIKEVTYKLSNDEIKKIRENAVNKAKEFSIEEYTDNLDDLICNI